MEISTTGTIHHASVSPISHQDLVLRHDLRPKSSLSDSGVILHSNQRSAATHHQIDLVTLTDEVNRETKEYQEASTGDRSKVLSMIEKSIQSTEDLLMKCIRILSNEDEELVGFRETIGEEGRGKQKTKAKERTLWEKRMSAAVKLAEEVELKIESYVESSKKEKRELERRVVSLTEENRDINGLLRVALSEKETVEKKLKGMNEQKRLALLQIAGRGLQRVGLGFGFGFGSGSMGENIKEEEGGGEEEEEEEESVVLMIEKTMKNLRQEISHLRRSLDETMSEKERLRRLAEKQTQKLGDNTLYIDQLEKRERLLAQNVEDLMMEIREAEAEVCRWREACELEVKAGQLEVEECNRLIMILKAELEKARSALAISEGKLKLKEELANAAMAAEEAAEKSLRLADRRVGELLSRVEQLALQLEEADVAERSRRKLRCKLCWPWPWRMVTAAAATTTSTAAIIRGTSLATDTRALLQHTA